MPRELGCFTWGIGYCTVPAIHSIYYLGKLVQLLGKDSAIYLCTSLKKNTVYSCMQVCLCLCLCVCVRISRVRVKVCTNICV